MIDAALAANAEPSDAPEDHKACCRELQKPHDAPMDWQGPRRGYCCSALAWRSGGACTPWGPPMPPAAHAEHARSAASSRLDLRESAASVGLGAIDAGDLRDAAIATWRGRMINEHGSAAVFEGLAAQLGRAGFSADVVEACAGFAVEERRHGVLCGAVVEALGGRASAMRKEAPAFTAHPDARGHLEAALRNNVSVCCASETVAVALIGAERLEMPKGPLRELLTEIYRDEVGHARFGWRLLAETLTHLPPAARRSLTARLDDYLPVAFAHLEAHELAHLPPGSQPPPEGARLGVCDGQAARRLFYETVEQVIVPSLEALGLAAARSWEQRTRHQHRWS